MFLNEKKSVYPNPKPPMPSKKDKLNDSKEITQKPKTMWKTNKLILKQPTLTSLKTSEEVTTPSSAKFKIFQKEQSCKQIKTINDIAFKNGSKIMNIINQQKRST